MIITITMRNVRLRNGIYEFRIRVPQDCQDSVGQKEITKSLKTEDKEEAALLAKKETDLWKQKFKGIRTAKNSGKTTEPSIPITAPDVASEFRTKLTAHKEQHLAELLGNQSDSELKESTEFYFNCLSKVRDSGTSGGFDLPDELGISFPLPEQNTPGITRKLNKILIDLLNELIVAVDDELGYEYSKELEAYLFDQEPPSRTPLSGNGHSQTASTSAQQTQSASSTAEKPGPTVAEVLKECLAYKERTPKGNDSIITEVASLLGWLNVKADTTPIKSITTNNLIDYRDNCLKHLPKNAKRMPDTKNLTVPQQVAYGKKNGGERIGISTLNAY